MLDNEGFNAYCRRLGLDSGARKAVDQIRSSRPSRRVGGGGRAVCARYPSRKMGAAIQAESLGCELAFVFLCEFDEEVLEFYDQPAPIRLVLTLPDGRTRAIWHTPDYFVLWADRAGWVECKTEEELSLRAQKADDRFVSDNVGRWGSPPGERYAAALGLSYQVWTPRYTDWTLQRNLRFLETYLREGTPNIGSAEKQLVVQAVEARPGILLSSLLKIKGVTSADVIYALIASREIYVDLTSGALADPDHVQVFRTAVLEEAYRISASCDAVHLPRLAIPLEWAVGREVIWNNSHYTIANLAESTATLLNEEANLVPMALQTLEDLVVRGKAVLVAPCEANQEGSTALDLLKSTSPADLQDALRRNRALTRAGAAGASGPGVPERTLRRWRAQHRHAERLHGHGLLGLIGQRHKRGNRLVKTAQNTADATRKFVEEYYDRPKQQSRMAVYRMLVLHCEKEGISPPCYRTFCKAVKHREGWHQTMARKGARAAYQERPFHDREFDHMPRHGDRPFELAHLDHTLGDIELVHSETGKDLGRPWITKLSDAYSRRILAVYCTFDPPSYASCMMVLIECVRRHRRLPDSIMTDRGREFGSTHFETLLAYYGVTHKTRPPASPRHGSVDERLFGTMNSGFIHNLQGNTQLTTSVRQVTDAVNPKRLAVWTLPEFHNRLCDWCYEVYDKTEHSKLGVSPREAFERGVSQFGVRPQRLVPYDEQFRFLALPSTATGDAKIDPQRGVKIHYVYYSCSAFRRPGKAGTRVPVRYDPFKCGIAYAYVDGQWETCQSQEFETLRKCSHREAAYALSELRAQYRKHQRKSPAVSAREIAIFLTSNEAAEQLMDIRRKEAESRHVNRIVLGMEAEEENQSRRGPIGPDGREWIVTEDPPSDPYTNEPTLLDDYV